MKEEGYNDEFDQCETGELFLWWSLKQDGIIMLNGNDPGSAKLVREECHLYIWRYPVLSSGDVGKVIGNGKLPL